MKIVKSLPPSAEAPGADTPAMRLFALLEVKRQLPIKELTLLSAVSRKTLERNRKFIIAAAIIMQGDYPHLQAYLELPDGTTDRTVEGAGL